MAYNLCDQIWAVPYPDPSIIHWMTGNRVTAFVNLTRKDERLFYEIKSYKRLFPMGMNYGRFSLWTARLRESDRFSES